MPFISPASNHLTWLQRWLETSIGVVSPKLKMDQLALAFTALKKNVEIERGKGNHTMNVNALVLQVHES